MSTRAAIGVWVNRKHGCWRGVYHHFDGYPTGLGRALWELYHAHYEDRLSVMVEMLIDNHVEGWSSIVDADWSQLPNWLEWYDRQPYYDNGLPLPPQSYKARGEEPNPLDHTSDAWLEWAYIIDLEANTMTIFEEVSYEVRKNAPVWIKKATLPLTGSAPDWSIFE